ncbi:Photosystem I assembly protein Ycf3 [subsurface metagenome]
MAAKKKRKRKKLKSRKFIMRMDPQVDKTVDQALTMVDQGKVHAAEKIISELLEKHPDIHTVQYAMGVVCGMKGRHDEAIAYFDKAIKIFPYFVQAWFNKGASHQKKLEIGEMIRAYQKVIEIGDSEEKFVRHAKDVIIRLEQQIHKDTGLSLAGYLKGMDKFNEAFAAMKRKEWEDALRGFQEVLTIDPKHTQSYGNMGICYGNLGRKEEALEAFDKALELDPRYEPAQLNRRVVNSLKEGEKLEAKFEAVQYYKDYSARKRSLFRELLRRFWR